jgi:hypothetical protein
MERDVEETRQAKKEKQTGRQHLRNLDKENIIKYTLRKHILNAAQGKINRAENF